MPPLRGQLPVNGRRFRLTEVAGLSDNAGMNDTDNLLQTVEHETGPTPEWTVLWLHGLGADGHDFAPIVPELVRSDWPALRFVFPHAPVRPVTINNGMSMRAWYDIVSLEPGRIADRADEAGVRESITGWTAVPSIGVMLTCRHRAGNGDPNVTGTFPAELVNVFT